MSSMITGWYKDTVGSGGKAGSGGIIGYSNKENIFAYNGDMITNGDYTSVMYEYKEDGTQDTSKILKVYVRKELDGGTKKFIPSKIFAQTGIIRETYTTNQGEYTLSKVTRKLIDEVLPEIAKNKDEVCFVLATEKTPTTVTGYTNPLTSELQNQGIGSRSGIFRSFKWSF